MLEKGGEADVFDGVSHDSFIEFGAGDDGDITEETVILDLGFEGG